MDVGARVVYGEDWAWGELTPAVLKAAGASFALRYLSTDPSKNLTLAEAQRLTLAGIKCVTVWETTAARALQGYQAGYHDAIAAFAMAHACGQPSWRPVAFAVDFDESPQQAPLVADYARGWSDVAGKGRRGVYGGYWTVKRLFDAGLVDFAVQTIAWSGGLWDPRAQMQQFAVDKFLGGVSVDYDRAVAADYGGWFVGQQKPVVDPYWFLMPDEHQWVTEWNSLRHHLSPAAHNRRVHLRDLMIERRKAIWVAALGMEPPAQRKWNLLNRYQRYMLLKEYTVDHHRKPDAKRPGALA